MCIRDRGHLDKCLRGYAVLAATNNLDGEYRPEWGASFRNPPLPYMQLVFVSDWKLLPEGIYFDDDKELTGNYIFGRPNESQPTYTGAVSYTHLDVYKRQRRAMTEMNSIKVAAMQFYTEHRYMRCV